MAGVEGWDPFSLSDTHMRNATVHVILLNYNGAADTIACIGSLRSVSSHPIEIIAVDNASTDGSAETLKRTFPGLTILESPTNTGYAGGNNLGIRYALEHGAEYIVVMNNDVVVTPGFLEPMIAMLAQDPTIGVTTCKVFYKDSPEKVFAAAGRFNAWLCTGMNKGGYIERHFRNSKPGFTDFIPGVLFLARRRVFEEVGFFDARYFMYFEDVEFSRRVVQRFKIGYTPDGVVYHKSGGGTAVRNYTTLYNYYHTRNRLLTFSDEPVFYRSYVICFSLLNIAIKSLLQAPNILSSPQSGIDQIGALWRGMRDGMRMMAMEGSHVG